MDGMWGKEKTLAAKAKIEGYSLNNNSAPTDDAAYKAWLLDKLKVVHAEDYSEIEEILIGLWGNNFPGESKMEPQKKLMDGQAEYYRRLMQLIDDSILYEGAVFGRNLGKIDYI